ncbi:MAG: SpoIIE family protein phosphatase, partial [Candidatus Krumholzibacteriota bacterium]|nr:SpoIIE family protein phosphatase [Candidatus Krumholzibacteriota bacterium]
MSALDSVAISVAYFVSGVLFFLLGLTILRTGRASTATRAAAMMLFFAGAGPMLSASGLVLESNPRAGSVVYSSMLETFEYLWEFFFPALMLFALSFPREFPTLRRYPIIALFVFLPYIFHFGVMMYGDRMLDLVHHLSKAFPSGKEITLGTRVVAVESLDNVLGALIRLLERVHRNFFVVVNIAYSSVAMTLLWRGRRELVNPRVAQQMRTLTIGIGCGVACYTLTKISMMFTPSLLAGGIDLALLNVALLVSGGTIAYAVLRQQFLGIRNVVRRGLLYTGVAASFAVLYIIVVRPISNYFGQHSAVSHEVFETAFIILAIIAFQPALSRTEEVLEQMFFRGHLDATRRMRLLGDAIAVVTTTEELESALAQGLRETLETSGTSLVLIGDNPGPSPVALLLEEIREPVQRKDLERLRDHSRRGRGSFVSRMFRRARARDGMDETFRAALESVAGELLDGKRGADAFEVFVPLFRDKVCVGFIGLSEKIYGVPYSSEDLGYLAVLSTQVSSALRNLRLLSENLERKLFEEELKIARKIQTQLLPGDPPSIAGFDLCAVTVPSRYVGGDYYDFVLVEQKWLVIVVADVSGKGIPASILTASLQAAVRSNADAQTDP